MARIPTVRIKWARCACGCGGKTPQRRLETPDGILEPPTFIKGHEVRVLTPRLERYEYRPATGCWNWLGALTDRGWGQVRWQENGRRIAMRAHRYFWTYLRGPIPEGFDVHHTCGNRRCVNPEHLELVDHAAHASMHRRPVAA